MMVSLSPAKMTGSEVDQTTLDGALTFMRPNAAPPLPERAVLERQPEGVGVPVQVHHHAGQQGSALVVLAEIEVAHLKREVRGNILEPAVLLHLEGVLLRTRLELVNMGRVEDRLGKPYRIADPRVGLVERHGDDVRVPFDFLDLLAIE